LWGLCEVKVVDAARPGFGPASASAGWCGWLFAFEGGGHLAEEFEEPGPIVGGAGGELDQG
jgi:hypothetical protein